MITALLFSVVSAYADVRFNVDVDRPTSTQVHDFGLSEDVNDHHSHIQLTCKVFPEFILLTYEDPALVGAGYILRPRKPKAKTKELCEAVEKPTKFTFWGGSLKGVLGSLVVYSGEEPNADLDYLTFYDFQKGEAIFTAAFNSDAPFLIDKRKGTLSAKFEAFLEFPGPPCNPVVDAGGKCLKSILQKNGIAESGISLKNLCAEAQKKNARAAKAGSVHLFIETYVADIRAPSKKTTGKTIGCRLSQ